MTEVSGHYKAEQIRGMMVDLKQAARDFEENFKGKLDGEELQVTLDGILNAEEGEKRSCYCHGSITSMIFYWCLNLTTDGDNWEFKGYAGRAASPGEDKMFGTLFTRKEVTLDELFECTIGFFFYVVPGRASLYFYDGRRVLGHFQGGGVSSITDSGGGVGRWRRV